MLGESQMAYGLTPQGRASEADQKEILAARLYDATSSALTEALRERGLIWKEQKRRRLVAEQELTARRDEAKAQARQDALNRQIESLTRQSIGERLRGAVAGAFKVGTRYEGIEGADMPSVTR